MSKKKEVLKWTRECLHCKRFYKCKGRASNEPCLNYEEREEDGRCQMDKDGYWIAR